MKKLLIVGAGGFIGGYIADEAVKRGYDTYVAVRESTSLKFLGNPELKKIILDYDDPENVKSTLTKSLDNDEKWDYIIYNLGATKCVNFLDFKRINFGYLKMFVEALKEIGKIPEKFLYVSSLSALGEGDEINYTPFKGDEFPNPETAYGLSKIQAESYLEHISGIPFVIFRPTGVYGPHEKDYLMMIKSIDNGFDFTVGFKKQMLTFIYVKDLVRAMFLALESDKTVGKKYIISENRAYTQKEFRELVSKKLGKKFVIPVKIPLAVLKVVCFVSGKIGKWRLKPTTLNPDKYKIMKQRNWTTDVSAAAEDFGFVSEYSLERGLSETISSYKSDK